MREISLKEFQEEELKILKRIDQICREQNIRYWIMYGTLLGAIRHKGFIPWDDDIDVAMVRDDHERFIKYVREHPEECSPLVIDSYETKKGYPFYIPRICNTEYLLTFKGRSYTSGLFVDLYPFDGMGNDRHYWEKMNSRIIRIMKNVTLSTMKSPFYGKNLFHKILNFPNAIYSRLRGNVYFFEKLDRLEKQFKWEESTYASVPVWDYDILYFKKEWFDDLIQVPFENLQVYIPKRYDEILRECYGDYMKLPPVEQRIPHHNFVAYKL